MGTRIEWTDDMVTRLRQLRGKGVPILLCAEEVGVSYPVAVVKCRALGLAARMNSGRTPAEELMRAAA